jgi:hypothetical protein
MSQQINLFDPALLRKRELLTAGNLAVVASVLLLAFGGWGGWARSQLGALEQENKSVASQLKTLEERLMTTAKTVAGAKPDPRLESELAAARALLDMRGEVFAALKKGLAGESVGFAEYLRGFARQTPRGVWLTGFTVDEGGAAIEIRGRMTDAALLPEYIRRLNGEPAFKGRAFAALKIAAPQASARAGQAGSAQPPGANAAPVSPPYLEFTLVPAGAPDADRAVAEGKR